MKCNVDGCLWLFSSCSSSFFSPERSCPSPNNNRIRQLSRLSRSSLHTLPCPCEYAHRLPCRALLTMAASPMLVCPAACSPRHACLVSHHPSINNSMMLDTDMQPSSPILQGLRQGRQRPPQQGLSPRCHHLRGKDPRTQWRALQGRHC